MHDIHFLLGHKELFLCVFYPFTTSCVQPSSEKSPLNKKHRGQETHNKGVISLASVQIKQPCVRPREKTREEDGEKMTYPNGSHSHSLRLGPRRIYDGLLPRSALENMLCCSLSCNKSKYLASKIRSNSLV